MSTNGSMNDTSCELCPASLDSDAEIVDREGKHMCTTDVEAIETIVTLWWPICCEHAENQTINVTDNATQCGMCPNIIDTSVEYCHYEGAEKATFVTIEGAEIPLLDPIGEYHAKRLTTAPPLTPMWLSHASEVVTQAPIEMPRRLEASSLRRLQT